MILVIKYFFRNLIFLLPTILIAATTTAQELEVAWQHFEFGPKIGTTNIFCVDLDKDGIEELVFGWNGELNTDAIRSTGFVVVLKYVNGQYIVHQRSRYYPRNQAILNIQVADIDQDGSLEILAILKGGRVHIYNGKTMTLKRGFDSGLSEITQSVISDVDSDGVSELLIKASNSFRIISLDNFAIERSESGYSGYNIRVGNIDSDDEKEIVLEKYTLEAESDSVEWSYEDGFGFTYELGDIDQDGILEIIGILAHDKFAAFDAVEKKRLWVVEENNSNSRIHLTDFEGDGLIEILIGASSNSGGINCYSANTQNKLWQVDDVRGVANLVVGDPDGDGGKEIIWGTGHNSTASDHLVIANIDSLEIEWMSNDFDGPFWVAVSDLNGDNIPDIIGTSAQSNAGYDNAQMFIYDGATQKSIGERDLFNGSIYKGVSDVEAADLDGDGNVEIVAGIGKWIEIFNSTASERIWVSPTLDIQMDIELVDMDDDGVLEIITGDFSGFLTVFDGKTFEEKYKSDQFPNQISKIEIGNTDQDSSLEIVAITDIYNQKILRVYDGNSFEMEYERDMSNYSMYTLNVEDSNLDDKDEIILAGHGGKILILNNSSYDILKDFNSGELDHHIGGIALANLNSTPELEIVTISTRVIIYETINYTKVWESEIIGRSHRIRDVLITDIDNDKYADVFFGSDWGIFHYVNLIQSEPDLYTGFKNRIEIVNYPDNYFLSEIYPNPLRPQGYFTLNISHNQHISIHVYDILGRHVVELHDGHLTAELGHNFTLNGKNWPSGLYLIQISGESFQVLRKAILIR